MYSNDCHVYELSGRSREEGVTNVTIQDCDQPSKNTSEQPRAAYVRRATVISCLLFVVITAGLATLYALHFDFRETWYRESTDIEEKSQQIRDKHANETLLLRNDMDQITREVGIVNQNSESHRMNLNASFAKNDEQMLALISENAESALKKSEQFTGNLQSILAITKAEFFFVLGRTKRWGQGTFSKHKLSAVLIDVAASFYTGLGWTRSRNMFYRCFQGDFDYPTADTNCKNDHGRLAAATLRDPIVVKGIIDSKCHGAWIGFTDIKVEGKWEWSDGGLMNSNTTEWFGKQPDNYNDEEHCAEIFSSSRDKLMLNDDDCLRKKKYICEIAI